MTVMEDMVRRVEQAASHVTNATNVSDFLYHFVTTSGSMDKVSMKMFQAQVILTQEDAFSLRSPMAIMYSYPEYNDHVYAQRAALEGPSSLPSISRPPSIASLHLSASDEMLGPRPVVALPPRREQLGVALPPDPPGYATPGRQQPVLAPPGAPAYTNPRAPPAAGVPHDGTDLYPAPQLSRSLQPALGAGPGTRPIFEISRQPLGYRDGEPQRELAKPSASTGRASMTGLSSPVLGYEGPKGQFVSGPGGLPEFSMPYTSSGDQLVTDSKLTAAQTGPAPAPATVHAGPGATDTAKSGRVETPSQSAKAGDVAPPSVQLASAAPQKPTEGAIEDVRGQGDACSLLAEPDRGDNNGSQPQGEETPAGSKASVSVPPGFTALHKQLPHIRTDMKTSLPDEELQLLESVMAGSVKSQSPGNYEYFTIPPTNTSIIGTTQKVVLSFYKSPSEFWLQLESDGEVLDDLLKNMATYYESKAAHQEFEAKVGMHCVARYTLDNGWYRVQILELLPDHAKVFYVDFGNWDRVPLTELCLLAEQFASLPVQAFPCSTKGMFTPGSTKHWPLSTVRVFRDMIGKDGMRLEAKFYLWDRMTSHFIVDVLGQTGDGPVANLSAEFITICARESLEASQVSLHSMEVAGPAAQQPPAAGGPSGSEPPPAVKPAGEQGAAACRDGTVSVPTSAASAEAVLGGAPACMPVPPASTAILATGTPLSSSPQATEPPVVVPEVAKPAALCRSPLRTSRKALSSEGARLPRKPTPPGHASAVPPPGTVPPPLLPPGAAPRPPPTVAPMPRIPPSVVPDKEAFSFVLSVIFTPADFYGQILTGSSTPGMMEELHQQLNQVGAAGYPPPRALVTKGTFWICEYQHDKNYYRSMILEAGNTNDGWRARVVFVDYGNRGLVELEKLRFLPEHLAKLPACAHRMSLALVNPVQGSKWSKAAKELFLTEAGFNTVVVAEKKGQYQDGLETVAEVVLWNKNGQTPVNVNILLVEKKLAQLKTP